MSTFNPATTKRSRDDGQEQEQRAPEVSEPEEERRHWCFHVMVSDRYSDWRQTQTIFPRSPVEQPVTTLSAAN